IEISQIHREMKEALVSCQAIMDINKQLKQEDLSEKDVCLSANLSSRDIWESGITTYLDEIPFANIGKGEQSLIKTKLALKHKKARQATTLLLEEPENHLSYGKLHELLKYIDQNREGRQVIVSTHSSFVINKLGMENLIILARGSDSNKRHKMRLTDLKPGTISFFKRLPGYDTLRLILCKQAILVEGPSDELIVQKAYYRQCSNLPIEDGIDIISVGTSFLRFLEIAEKLDKKVIVVTDNDGDVDKVYKKYRDYPDLALYVDTNIKYNTLEPQIVFANKNDLDNLREILNLDERKYPDADSIVNYMSDNKTEVALKLFETETEFNIPNYISRAVGSNEV
ncbi:MAG: AAA family ATPase, partial [Epulopiscium sp.]|nr:AAA family ATPase [Candidatus Epulonipiscium sp.]